MASFICGIEARASERIMAAPRVKSPSIDELRSIISETAVLMNGFEWRVLKMVFVPVEAI